MEREHERTTADLFINRSRGSKELFIVLAGYKEFLWKYTIERMPLFVPPEVDVCVVVSGVESAVLVEMASRYGWSYLQTKADLLARAQNIAIQEHPNAQYIYKIDEDILISRNYCGKMLQGYRNILSEGKFRPGFVAPLINVNGQSYIEFLKMINAVGKYERKFGEARAQADGIPIHYDGNAAKWIWSRSLPFDHVASRFDKAPFAYNTVVGRFSIGALLLEREMWETIGGFAVSPEEGWLGFEEEHLCRMCMELNRPIAILHNVFAGHFSFYPQFKEMRSFLKTIYPFLMPDRTNN